MMRCREPLTLGHLYVDLEHLRRDPANDILQILAISTVLDPARGEYLTQCVGLYAFEAGPSGSPFDRFVNTTFSQWSPTP